MRKIYLIRHAQTQANLEKRFCGSTESPILWSVGEIRQMILDKIPLQEMGKIISSPSMRAKSTALAISENVEIVADLREIDFGKFENETLQDIRDKYPEEFANWTVKEDFQFPEGERASDFFQRVTEAFQKLCDDTHSSVNTTVFTHGGVIQSILSYLLVGDNSLFWKFKIDHCGIVQVTVDKDVVSIDRLNF